MSDVALRGAVELGLVYGLVAVGLFLSYRILNLADLTVDGSFTLGAASSIMLTAAGMPWLGILAAVLTGAAAGFVTGGSAGGPGPVFEHAAWPFRTCHR